ncbi:hypothetical protein [Caudoviricetes sp.]|nr:hypothetical protein [Caudoviricetes sp.]UOF81016.1 hypothetical protein [Caudoviricetes sp.]UOF81412.1 hypothetical protein [Caudoviricetes sp.]
MEHRPCERCQDRQAFNRLDLFQGGLTEPLRFYLCDGCLISLKQWYGEKVESEKNPKIAL